MQPRIDPVPSLKRIDAWISRRHPDRLPMFRRGAEAEDIQRIEMKLGRAMLPDIRRLYAAHDGQPDGAPHLYLNQRWLPLDLAALAWEDLCLRHGRHASSTAITDDGQAAVLDTTTWLENWFPLFGSAGGDHYCVELCSDGSHRPGRVIWFLHDLP